MLWLALLVFSATVLMPRSAAGDPIRSARVVANGDQLYLVALGQPVRRAAGAKGVAAAGAEVSTSPPNADERTDYRVSVDPGGDEGNQPANDDDAAVLKEILEHARDGAKAMLAKKRPTLDVAKGVIGGIVEDIAPADDTPLKKIEKRADKPLLARTAELELPGPVKAQAEARQTLAALAGGAFSYNAFQPASAMVPAGEEAGRTAVAVAFNLDPIAVEWNQTAGVRVDLSDTWLELATVGAHTSALGFVGSAAAFLNDTIDLDSDHRQANPLYELIIVAYSLNGGPTMFDVTLDAFGNQITDSRGNVDASTIQSALVAQLSAPAARLDFDRGYYFDVTIPASPAKSVLFLRDISGAAAHVPEASGTSLFIVGLIAGAASRRGRSHRRRRDAVERARRVSEFGEAPRA